MEDREIIEQVRKAERLDAILRYVEGCKYGPEAKIIYAIAGYVPTKNVEEDDE